MIENINQSQIRQREALRRIKEQNQTIASIFISRVLKAKIKSFTANFFSYLKSIDKISPEQMRANLFTIQQYCKVNKVTEKTLN
jgi:hypothetical protein